MLSLLCLCPIKEKAWMTTPWFTDYFKPTVDIFCTEEKLPFKVLLSLTKHWSFWNPDGDAQ